MSKWLGKSRPCTMYILQSVMWKLIRAEGDKPLAFQSLIGIQCS